MPYTSKNRIAVIIPCYKVKNYILPLIENIGTEVWRIYIIDDACPEATGTYVDQSCDDPRLVVIKNPVNLGVGGAVMRGYRAAVNDGALILVKVDGDGQMDPKLITDFVSPIIVGEADYTKGNRFYDLEKVRSMPTIRLIGNAALSLMTKLSSGYWNLFDPTNGYTAIHADIVRRLPLDKISQRYFFETDILFRLNTLRAVVVDIPMEAKYEGACSSLRIPKIIGEFMVKHASNLIKRLFYNYYLRDMSLASIELPIGMALFFFGVIFGSYHWLQSLEHGLQTPAGTVMVAALPIILGIQIILAFVGYDISTVPTRVIHRNSIVFSDIAERFDNE